YAAAQRLTVAFGVALAGAIVVAAYFGAHDALALLGVWLGVWLIAGAFAELAFRIKVGGAPLAENVRRLRGLPRSALGTTLAHAGVGVTVLGIIVATTWSTEAIRSMKTGESLDVGGYSLTLDGFVERPGPNYHETAARFSVRSGGALLGTMEPAKRQFEARQMATTEAAIRTIGFSQIYLSLGDSAADG